MIMGTLLPIFLSKKYARPDRFSPRTPFERSEKQSVVRHKVLILKRILIVTKLGLIHVFVLFLIFSYKIAVVLSQSKSKRRCLLFSIKYVLRLLSNAKRSRA